MRNDISVAELLVEQKKSQPAASSPWSGLGFIFGAGAALMLCAYLLIQATYAISGVLGGPGSEAEMVAAVKRGAELRLKPAPDEAP